MFRLNRCFVGLLLLTGLVFPTVFFLWKSFLFAGSLFVSILILISGSVKINRSLLLISFLFPILGLAYSVYGLMAGTPGALHVLTVMVVYPLLFPIIAFTYKEGDFDRFFRIFLLAAWLVVFVDMTYVLSNLLLPGNFFVGFIQRLYIGTAVVDNSEEYFKFTLPNISSLIFLFPFFISAFLLDTNLAKRLNIFILILFMSILTILSGRRALFLAVFAGPVVAFLAFSIVNVSLVFRKTIKSTRWYLIALAIFISGFGFYFNLFDFYFSQITSISDFRNNASNLERTLQFDSLIDGIGRSPFFGSGAGAAASYSRSDTQPWAYELFYFAFIFQYGIFGFSIYLFGIFLLVYGFFYSIKRSGKSSFQYFFFSGFVSFLIANGSNPYLGKFDYMWVVFIPFTILISSLKKRM